jgi:mRNA interferase RelE/StbE
MSTVIVHRHAANYLRRLPKKTQKRIKDILKQLENDSLEHPDVRHMVGDWAGYHRIRVGNLRIIFWFDEKEDVVYVDHIGPRGDVYK